MAVLCCSLPGQVHDLKWWLMTFFVDDVDICYMYAEMGSNERTEMHLKFQDSRNASVFIPTPKVDVTGLNLPAMNRAVITQKCWVLQEQWQAFAPVVRLGHNRVPHTWLLNTDPGLYDDCASDLHKHSGVAQNRVRHGLMSRPSITTSMINRIVEVCADHKMWQTENGDTLESDEPLILECSMLHQGIPL